MKLEIKGLDYSYNSHPALREIKLKLASSQILGLVGPNGSGKSTLLKCIIRLLSPEKGTVLIQGERVKNLGRRELARKVGYVPQRENKHFPARVFDVVLTGRKPYIGWRESRRDRRIVTDILEKLDLERLAMRDIGQLSGGERQKVFLARALAQEPEILLLDEPTSNLDLKHQLEVLNTLRDEVQNRRISAILAIHDLNLALKYGDRFLMLKDGRIHAAGGKEIFSEKLLEEVYEVRIRVLKDDDQPVILPVEPLPAETI